MKKLLIILLLFIGNKSFSQDSFIGSIRDRWLRDIFTSDNKFKLISSGEKTDDGKYIFDMYQNVKMPECTYTFYFLPEKRNNKDVYVVDAYMESVPKYIGLSLIEQLNKTQVKISDDVWVNKDYTVKTYIIKDEENFGFVHKKL